MSEALTLYLPEPLSVNRLLRLHHRERSRHRDRLALRIRGQRPRGWEPAPRYRVDAELRLHQPRDPLELPGCLKIVLDACILAGIVEDDGPHHLVPGRITQRVQREARGLTLTITPLEAP